MPLRWKITGSSEVISHPAAPVVTRSVCLGDHRPRQLRVGGVGVGKSSRAAAARQGVSLGAGP